ncbi:MAG TPA: DNA repair protein RadA [Bacillota bacterium]|nr:DNA repair protein RadA [Bacillota bacterium]HUM55729.1 DNA repair protein RadA [Bacillota bacterium]
MAKKQKTVFVCQECGYESPKWMGQCICGAWNTMTEEKVLSFDGIDKRGIGKAKKGKRKPAALKDIRSSEGPERIDTGIGELNRVLGGGMVKGSLTLISGEPGIGKSTVIMQAALKIAEKYGRVLYVSGEESEEQIKMRADRICGSICKDLFIMGETNIENICASVEELGPVFVVIDSIQTMYTSFMESSPGSVSQVRACANELMRIGKVTGTPVFIVAHVTKSGELAGPKIIEHLVDCVLDLTGERNRELRIIRAQKNRFGTTSEIGAFEMTGEGLVEIENLSKTFLEGTEEGSDGSVVTAVHEGTRPLLLEVQALAAPVSVGFARRSSIGVDLSRLNMIIAVLEKKAGLPLMNQDIYVNIVGGLRPEGTSADLAVALAIYSACTAKPCNEGTIVIGEVGLTGNLRAVQNAEKIIKEAERMGFKKVILPKRNASKLAEERLKIELKGVSSITEAISVF